jgi:ATP-dependent Clp protease, protease subunit
MQSWYDIRARATGAEVLIYDEIGAYGVSAKGFLAELGALPEGTPIDLRLNSPGGSVFDAVAIFNALQRHDGTITVWIDGIAASAASYIAMAGDEIVMPENAFLMIHDPSGVVMGTASDMREMAGTMDKIAASMTRGYAARSGRSEAEIAALMAAETWFDARDALELGLATRMIEPVRIAASFDVARFRNAPPALVEAVEAIGADGMAPDADDPQRDADADEAEPETLAECKTFDPAQHDAPPSGVQTGDVGDPNIHSVETGSTVAPASAAPDPLAGRAAGPAPDPAAIRAEALAHARAVIDLCRLAGQPQMAGRFLEENASLETVRASLLASRASMAETSPEISPHHPQPGPGPSARPWGDVIARTFKLKG